jgi:hypothetical protein
MSKTLTDILLDKAIEAMTMAIEIYNKPLVKYRTDTSLILIVNAWENALKATIYTNKWAKLYDKKRGYYKPFDECLACVHSNSKNFNDSAYESVRLLYEQRCKVIHFNKSVELLDYMAIQANIIFFKNFLAETFKKSLIKDKTWYILPIGSELPFSKLDFLTTTSAIKNSPQDVKDYFRAVVETQNRLIENGMQGILVEVNVNMTNVQRIKNADIKVAVDRFSSDTVSLEKILKISSEGNPVKITMDEFKELQLQYPLSYGEIFAACRGNKPIKQSHFNQYMKGCQLNQNLALNWRGVCSSLSLPFPAPDKFMYKQEVIEGYKRLLS